MTQLTRRGTEVHRRPDGKYITNLPASLVRPILDHLGIEERVCERIDIGHTEVKVTVQLLNKWGAKYAVGCKGDPHEYDDDCEITGIGELARGTYTFPIDWGK